MKKHTVYVLQIIVGALLIVTAAAYAHCDTMNGPVVSSAKEALMKGDVTPVLKWVTPENEKEIREVFAMTLKVRIGGGEARELADRHFFETLVRVHRAGEGEPYTGLKPAGNVEAGIAAADEAIKHGSVNDLAAEVAKLAADGIRQRFAAVSAAKQHADDSVEAGRAYVRAYVEYIHYVEAIHALLSTPAGEHHLHPAAHKD